MGGTLVLLLDDGFIGVVVSVLLDIALVVTTLDNLSVCSVESFLVTEFSVFAILVIFTGELIVLAFF